MMRAPPGATVSEPSLSLLHVSPTFIQSTGRRLKATVTCRSSAGVVVLKPCALAQAIRSAAFSSLRWT
ncbi:hypothetical protein D3C85_1762510 [compost metagenome]